MEDKLKKHITESFNNNIAIVNGVEYVNINVFQAAVSELAILDCMLGALVYKTGEDISISEEEIIDFMSQYSDNVVSTFENGSYIIKKKHIKDDN